MRRSQRDVLLILLAIAAGSADAWSYLGLGHAFVANMTGNTVLLGIAVFLQGDRLHPCISLVCYVAGVGIAALLTRNLREGDSWPRAISITLFAESLLLAGTAIACAFASRSTDRPGYTPSLNVLLGCVALAIGMQSGAMLQLRVPGIVTTYITGTLTTLTSGLIRFFVRNNIGTQEEKLRYEDRLIMQAAVLSAYLLSAIMVGLLFRYARFAVGGIPAIAVLLVAIYGLSDKSGANA